MIIYAVMTGMVIPKEMDDGVTERARAAFGWMAKNILSTKEIEIVHHQSSNVGNRRSRARCTKVN